jgi:sugar (pentulose or hexulose) kinase
MKPATTWPSPTSPSGGGGLPVIAIFDVGKTNKKLFLFDEQYRIVYEHSEPFAEIVDEDGDPCEDLNRLTAWVLRALDAVLVLPQFEVRAVNATTYGASFVYLGHDGQPVGPLYNYLKPFPEALTAKFRAAYAGEDSFSVQTASPWLGSLNSGLMLYRLKHDKSLLFSQVCVALHLPQYISYLLTRQVYSDLTSVGCHTMLWDFRQADYHDWVRAEGLDQRLGSLFACDEMIRAATVQQRNGEPMPVGVGLHDSSAALIPYLATFTEPFILISTGTWCISLNPFNTEPLTADELAQDCLCYLQYKGNPVKASRLFAGYEHEQQTKRLAAHFGVAHDHYTQVVYEAALADRLRQTTEPARSFAERDLTQFADYETAYHQFMLDIVAAQVRSTMLVLPSDMEQAAVSRMFVDGGFSKNTLYMAMLAAAFPQMTVWAAEVAQATALGAALAVHDHWNKQPVPADLIALTQYANPEILLKK